MTIPSGLAWSADPWLLGTPRGTADSWRGRTTFVGGNRFVHILRARFIIPFLAALLGGAFIVGNTGSAPGRSAPTHHTAGLTGAALAGGAATGTGFSSVAAEQTAVHRFGASGASGTSSVAKSGTAGTGATAPRTSPPASAPPSKPATTVTTTTVPSSAAPVIGVSAPVLLTEPPATQAAWLANLKSIGVTSVRIGADWAWISYAGPGTYDWGQLDQEVASVRAAGLSMDMVVMGTPSWAAAAGESGSDVAQPANASQFGQFAAAVAQRYAPQGVQDYEIWNEPNNTVFWLPAPNPAAYVQLLKASYTDIKAVDPGALVISGGLAPEANQGGNINEVTFLQDMYANGAKGYFDALGDHPYSYPALPNTYEAWSGWSQMNATPTSLRSVMAANGDGSKQIWATEVGAPTGGPDSVGTSGQAQELTQAIDDAKTSGWIGGLYIYTYQDSGGDPTTDEDWFGLLNADGSPKPAWSAVAAAIG